MSTLPFVKYQGAGNDFVLLDFCQSTPLNDLPSLARRLCDRRHGIGADGLLALLPSTQADYRMSIFNADGSEPAMCGNGIRCLASYIFKLNSSLSKVTIETQQAIVCCRKLGEDVAVDLGQPSTIHWPILLKDREVYVVDTGVPHAVIFVEDLDQVLLEEEGRSLRMDPQFAPHGVNVNFVKRVENQKLAIRTYERGVEGETLACGTGAAAAAFVAMKAKPSDSSVSVLTRSSFETSPFTYQEKMGFSLLDERIEMKGSAVEVFRGEIEI